MTSGESKPAVVEKTHHLHYLNEFRVEACPLFKQHQCQQHRPYTCFNWHFANQRRRRPQRKSDGSFNYSPDIYCDKYDENTGICPDGDECVYLHRVSGDVERKYHLRYYKTAQCVHPTDSRGQCIKNGAHCAFAHSSADLRQPQFDQHEAGFSTTVDGDGRDRTSFVIEDPLWHSQDHVLSCYKTEQCRKPARLCRQGYACPFYHNSKDRRRPPAICKYRSTPCPAAKTVDEWLDPELCEAGDSCQYCHTRTEQQFHPEIYKSTKCNDMLEHGYCPRAVFCAFAHHDSELHVQRTPYVTSSQASPKEQCSPNTNGGDSMRFGSPISNGTSTPSYSSVLKQRHPMVSKGYSATTDQISSSYPKAPGYERGPLSPNRNNESSMGRLRTHSLNMAHLDLGRQTQGCNVGGFEAASGTSLPSHSSLCRSDSGFHAVTEELSLDLAPIEEHQKPLSELFSGNMSSVSSPMRIPGAESFHTSPLTSFSEMLFGPAKSLLATSSQIAAFENQEGPDVSDELAKTKMELRSHHDKVAIWEEGLKQARQACEAWKADAEHYKMKAEQAEMERNRAVFERDQLMQQLEAVKMHLASTGLSLGGLVTPQLAPSSNEYNEGVLRAALQNSQPHNMFVDGIDELDDFTKMARERADIEAKYGRTMQQFAEKWKAHVGRAVQHGSVKKAWLGLLEEAEAVSVQHNRVKDRLLDEVLKTLALYRKENYHPSAFRAPKEIREAEEGFERAQRKWKKLYEKLESSKKAYYSACRQEKSALVNLTNSQADSSVSQDGAQKLRDRLEKCRDDAQKCRNIYEKNIAEITQYRTPYIEDMTFEFEKCQAVELKRSRFFVEMVCATQQVLVDLARNNKFAQLHGNLEETLRLCDECALTSDLQAWSATNGKDARMEWPTFEEYTEQIRTIAAKGANNCPSAVVLTKQVTKTDDMPGPASIPATCSDNGKNSDSDSNTFDSRKNLTNTDKPLQDQQNLDRHWEGQDSPPLSTTTPDSAKYGDFEDLHTKSLATVLYDYSPVENDEISLQKGRSAHYNLALAL